MGNLNWLLRLPKRDPKKRKKKKSKKSFFKKTGTYKIEKNEIKLQKR